ncbi:MAG TPA: gamma carbonic anhydrase family protein [Thermoplasmatales archaeon]|nr:gamma carbonic anhydrase family protein [Candidatus Thermoplasmatota archaeon]HDS59741.1 gamma carbonic anhydrase family protein [Thermoplasmatales archaeon]
MIIGKGTYVADSAVIIGDVRIGEQCSVWEHAVIRGDLNNIVIGNGSNVQDCCVLHVSSENSIEIGDGVSVGHCAMVHGARVDDDCIIGINATVLDGAHIGEGCIIGANAVVPPGMSVPAHSLAVGVPAKVVRQDEGLLEETRRNAAVYRELASRYLNGDFR